MGGLSKKEVLLYGALAVAGFFVFKRGFSAINPMDENNIFNTGANTVYKAITGSDGTIGTDIYNATHTDKGENILNPASTENPIYKGANSIYRGLSGSDGTIGTGIYDATHDEYGNFQLFGWKF